MYTLYTGLTSNESSLLHSEGKNQTWISGLIQSSFNPSTAFFYWHSGDFGILKAKVNRSQMLPENSHKEWIIIISMENGRVVTTHSTCIVG